MREVRIKTSEERAVPMVQRLQALGIARVSLQREFVYGPDRWQAALSTETSIPDAARVVAEPLDSSLFDVRETSITVRELRCIVNQDSVFRICSRWASDWAQDVAPPLVAGRLAAQGALALAATIGILLGCSALLAFVLPGPLQFEGFLAPEASALVAIGIGTAAALPSLDDTGKRELIGREGGPGRPRAVLAGNPSAWLPLG
jgi:hypothetical protein